MFQSLVRWLYKYRANIRIGFLVSIALTLIIFCFARYVLELDSWDSIFTFGQFFVGAVLFPATILSFILAAQGFYIASQEFRKSLEKPNVDLFWQDTQKEVAIIVPKFGHRLSHLQPTLVNTGNAVGLWYILDLRFPLSLAPDLRVKISGNEENWRVSEKTDTQQAVFTFMSNGNVAVYPEYPLILAEISCQLSAQKRYEEYYTVHYSIATTWGKRIDQELRLRVIAEE